MAVPCLNTSRVAGAVRGHAEWRRPRVSTARIADGHGRKEPHAMTMEKRRGKGRGRRVMWKVERMRVMLMK